MPWDYNELSQNPNITFEIIKNNQDKPWEYKLLSCNPNITWDIIKENPNIPWDYFNLIFNPMTKAKNDFINNKSKYLKN